MARKVITDRKNCQQADSSISLPSAPSRKANTIVDTPRRVRLLCDAQHTAGKLPRKQLFLAHNIPESTGYRILKSQSSRRGDNVHKRGRNPALASFERDAIETAEDASFRSASASHYANASALGLAHASERAIQRNMAEHGVGTFRAIQKKFINSKNIEKRGIWAFERKYWKLKKFKRYRYSDECHFACALQRQALVHRRRGREAREAPTKTQFKFKRQNQIWHVFAYIGWNYKSSLTFFTGAGGGGRLTQADYLVLLEKVVAPNWNKDWILLEDNDGAHGTCGEADNKVKQAKRRLGIEWESNCSESPDLNSIETIWRIVKQRLKNRGLILDPADLRQAIEEEWDRITLEEINKAISTMPERVAAVRERDGLPIPF